MGKRGSDRTARPRQEAFDRWLREHPAPASNPSLAFEWLEEAWVVAKRLGIPMGKDPTDPGVLAGWAGLRRVTGAMGGGGRTLPARIRGPKRR